MEAPHEESRPAQAPRHLTAWHVILLQLIRDLTDPRLVDVRDFDKLGTLPLEADIILLRKVADVDLAAQMPELDFLFKHLHSHLVVEYKSPEDRLDFADLDTARIYGLLAKRKYKLTWDGEVRVALLYSRASSGVFERFERNRYRFQPLEPGVLRCDQAPFEIIAINLAKLGEAQPDKLINLVSTRHQQFAREVGMGAAGHLSDDQRLAIIDKLIYLIRTKERIYGMSLQELQGYQELSDDLATVRRRFMQNSSPEERLEGLAPEVVLKNYRPEERLKGMTPDEVLKGMSPENQEQLLAMLLAERGQR